jgi:long-chain acyl-CoA synthetase
VGAVELIGFRTYVEKYPSAVAVTDVDGTVITRQDLSLNANRLAHALRSVGVGVGDRVAYLSENSVKYFEWSLACGQIGAHFVPINFHLTPGEIAHVIRDCSAKVVGASVLFADTCTAACDAAGFHGPKIAVDGEADGFLDPSSFILNAPDSYPAPRIHGSVMLYTAGTTGLPKGVYYPARLDWTPEDAARALMQQDRRRGLRPEGRTLITGPLYHGAPGAFARKALDWGHTVTLMDKWDSREVLRLIQDRAITHLQAAPIHFHRLLRVPEDERSKYDVSSLEVVSHAGAGTPIEVKRAMMQWLGPVLYEYYAASEGYATVISPEEWLAHPGSVGHRRSDGLDIVILGEDGDELPPGEIGTIHVRPGDTPPSRYLGEQTSGGSGSEVGLRTFGDMGYLDDDGWLFIVDRRSDMILSGGVNIYPAEIEQVLMSYPAVAEAIVFGVPDAEWGQRVRAVVVPEGGIGNTFDEKAFEQDLRELCDLKLARLKHPGEFDFVGEIPRSPTGKVSRTKIRDSYLSG